MRTETPVTRGAAIVCLVVQMHGGLRTTVVGGTIAIVVEEVLVAFAFGQCRFYSGSARVGCLTILVSVSTVTFTGEIIDFVGTNAAVLAWV